MKPSVALIVPFYNNFLVLKTCLVSLHKTVEDPQIVVVDDSVDEIEHRKCLEFCEEAKLHYVRMMRNSGFIQATLAGAKVLRTDWLCFINSDTEAQAYGWLDKMIPTDPQEAVVGAKLIFPDIEGHPFRGKLQHAGVAVINGGLPFHPFRGLPADLPEANVRRSVRAVTGAVFLVRGSVWDELGGWDQKLGRGVFEDVDFCWRVVQAGHKVIYEPAVTFVHHESASLDSAGNHPLHMYSAANSQYILAKWANTPFLQSDEHLFGLPAYQPPVLDLGPRLRIMLKMTQSNGLAAFLADMAQKLPPEQRKRFAEELLQISDNIPLKKREFPKRNKH